MKSLQYYFTAQHENEETIRIVHRHWFNIFMQYIPIFILFIIVVFSLIFYSEIIESFSNTSARAIFFFMLSFLALFMWIYGFLLWFDYYLDIWIITTHRIVNVDQKGLFAREVGELEYKRIQDISTDVKGFFPTILNYGNLTVQTAAEQSHFLFKSVGDPYEIKGVIMKQVKKRRREHPNQNTEGGL
ncbi:MAG: PH domain-containing protein [Patescibacteria group bacterium]|nr:PH domain-containing protein [Patescibacteria group bacterium]